VPSDNVVRFPERRIDGQLWEAWVKEDQIARHFAVSTRTVRRWRKDGLPSQLVGGSRRYRIGEAEAWHAARDHAHNRSP
jgi:hypothetical protein